jgi:hypothetical protein
MKTVVKTVAIAAVLGVLLIGAVPVQANSAGDPPSLLKHSCGKGDRMLEHLDRLEAAGYDVSAIRAAVEGGEMETARTLLQEFMEEHKEEFISLSEKYGRKEKQSGDTGNRMEHPLDRLEAAGYDVSAIRTAVESGDTETARTLMRAFMEEHKNASPNPPAGGRPVRGGMREIPTARV